MEILTPGNVYTILLIGVVTLLAISIFNPFYGIISYMATMMLRFGLYYPILDNIRFELIVGIIVLIEILFYNKYNVSFNIHSKKTSRYLFIFIVTILLSFIQSLDYKYSWDYTVLEVLKVYVFFIMIVCIVNTEKQIKLFVLLFCIITFFVGYEGIYLYVSGGKTYIFQGVHVATASEGLASGHVAAANIQLQALPIMLYIFIGSNWIWKKVVALLLAVLSVVGVIATGSRGGVVGLIFIGAALIYYSKNKILTSFLIISAFMISLQFLPGSYKDWMETIPNPSDASAISRITGLENGIEMFIKRPILGVGPGCFSIARKKWFGWGLESHNQFGQLFGELGILGTTTWFLFFFSMHRNIIFCKAIFRQYNLEMFYLMIGLQIALYVRLLEGMFSHSLYVFFWYMMAALSICISTYMVPNKITN